MEWSVFLLFLSLVVLFLSYFLFDVNYFLRTTATIVYARYARKRIPFLGKSTIYGIVTQQDADCWLTHMNNARTFREFDFCRFDHLTRTGMLKIIWKNNGGGVVAAQTCRYRRALHMFMPYKIETTPVFYDNRSIYFEHVIVSLKDNMIRATAYVKLTTNLDLEKVISKHYRGTVKPEIPKDLELYTDYIRVNSEKLKRVRKRSRSLSTTKDTISPTIPECQQSEENAKEEEEEEDGKEDEGASELEGILKNCDSDNNITS